MSDNHLKRSIKGLTHNRNKMELSGQPVLIPYARRVIRNLRVRAATGIFKPHGNIQHTKHKEQEIMQHSRKNVAKIIQNRDRKFTNLVQADAREVELGIENSHEKVEVNYI